MSATVYTENDADLKALQGKTLAVIGYGSQGHAHARNLKESGCEVVIGLYEGSRSKASAEKQGFEVLKTADAVKKADVILFAIPDMRQPQVFREDVEPNLTADKTLFFVHGLSIHYKLIEVPSSVNVGMVAPKGPGHIVRSQYLEGKGVPALIAIHQDPSGTTRDLALAWAKGIGAARAGVLETSFREETETDLFGEQAVLCGGATALVEAGFETLVEAGYAPEMAYFECLHELKLIVDLMVESGIAGMRFSISETAEYGDYTRGPRIIDDHVKANMKGVLKEIQDGSFTKEWVEEYKNGLPNYKRYYEETKTLPIEETGRKLRGMMSWLKQRNLEGAQADYE